jgi:FKBP-type peptidyl-prolyl cis-trans isomerase FkpA
MDSFRFRPQVSSLEDRLTPAVSPQELLFETSRFAGDTFAVQHTLETANKPRSLYSINQMAIDMAGVAQRSGPAYTKFLDAYTELTQLNNATPGGLPGYNAAASWILQNLFTAQTNFSNSVAILNNVYGVIRELGGTIPEEALLPEPPPPPPSPEDNDEFDSEVQLSTSLPDLNDPRWQAQGDQGLRILDVTTGTGAEVQAGDSVRVNYIGFLTNGTVFDSSIERNQPSTFSLNQVIQGWQQGIPGMRVGGVRRLDVPSELGYGTIGSPPSIPPNSRLVFEVQVLGIETPQQTTPSVTTPINTTPNDNFGGLTQDQIDSLFNQQ